MHVFDHTVFTASPKTIANPHLSYSLGQMEEQQCTAGPDETGQVESTPAGWDCRNKDRIVYVLFVVWILIVSPLLNPCRFKP